MSIFFGGLFHPKESKKSIYAALFFKRNKEDYILDFLGCFLKKHKSNTLYTESEIIF